MRRDLEVCQRFLLSIGTSSRCVGINADGEVLAVHTFPEDTLDWRQELVGLNAETPAIVWVVRNNPDDSPCGNPHASWSAVFVGDSGDHVAFERNNGFSRWKLVSPDTSVPLAFYALRAVGRSTMTLPRRAELRDSGIYDVILDEWMSRVSGARNNSAGWEAAVPVLGRVIGVDLTPSSSPQDIATAIIYGAGTWVENLTWFDTAALIEHSSVRPVASNPQLMESWRWRDVLNADGQLLLADTVTAIQRLRSSTVPGTAA